MLKDVWNSVKGYLPENVQEYLGGTRYIKFDGTPYDKKGWDSVLYRPEVKVGLGYLLLTSALQYLNPSQDQNLTATFIGGLIGTGIVSALAWNGRRLQTEIHIPKSNKAIDTEGRDLSRKQLTLGEYQALKESRNMNILVIPTWIVLGVLFNPENILEFDMIDIAVIAYCAVAADRYHKLMTGEYCFVDERGGPRNSDSELSYIL